VQSENRQQTARFSLVPSLCAAVSSLVLMPVFAFCLTNYLGVSLATARARFVWYGSMHATWCASLCSEQTAESQDSLRIACTFDGRLLLRRLLRVFECAKVHASSRYERSAIRKSLPLSLFISLSLSLSLSLVLSLSLSPSVGVSLFLVLLLFATYVG
jgi:hypothetical protein